MAVPCADGKLGVAGHSREKGAGCDGDGYVRTPRQLWPRHGKALRQDRHQSRVLRHRARILDGCFHREKAGAARHACRLPGAAAKQLKEALKLAPKIEDRLPAVDRRRNEFASALSCSALTVHSATL